MRCLEYLSKTVPTNGPTTEYGNKTTVNPSAAAMALACRSGEKSTNDASPL